MSQIDIEKLSVSYNFKNYIDNYVKKSTWVIEELGKNSHPYFSLSENKRIFAYIDYSLAIIHIPEILIDNLKHVNYKKISKSDLIKRWNMKEQIEIKIDDESKFDVYLDILKSCCRKINP